VKHAISLLTQQKLYSETEEDPYFGLLSSFYAFFSKFLKKSSSKRSFYNLSKNNSPFPKTKKYDKLIKESRVSLLRDIFFQSTQNFSMIIGFPLQVFNRSDAFISELRNDIEDRYQDDAGLTPLPFEQEEDRNYSSFIYESTLFLTFDTFSFEFTHSSFDYEIIIDQEALFQDPDRDIFTFDFPFSLFMLSSYIVDPILFSFSFLLNSLLDTPFEKEILLIPSQSSVDERIFFFHEEFEWLESSGDLHINIENSSEDDRGGFDDEDHEIDDDNEYDEDFDWFDDREVLFPEEYYLLMQWPDERLHRELFEELIEAHFIPSMEKFTWGAGDDYIPSLRTLYWRKFKNSAILKNGLTLKTIVTYLFGRQFVRYIDYTSRFNFEKYNLIPPYQDFDDTNPPQEDDSDIYRNFEENYSGLIFTDVDTVGYEEDIYDSEGEMMVLVMNFYMIFFRILTCF